MSISIKSCVFIRPVPSPDDASLSVRELNGDNTESMILKDNGRLYVETAKGSAIYPQTCISRLVANPGPVDAPQAKKTRKKRL